jgi:hypothetical protein
MCHGYYVTKHQRAFELFFSEPDQVDTGIILNLLAGGKVACYSPHHLEVQSKWKESASEGLALTIWYFLEQEHSFTIRSYLCFVSSDRTWQKEPKE